MGFFKNEREELWHTRAIHRRADSNGQRQSFAAHLGSFADSRQ